MLASQRSSIRDNQLIVAYRAASFCLSTYSGNFLIDDQFLTNDSSFFTFFGLGTLFRRCQMSRVYPLRGGLNAHF